ncbi:tRNA pseudouridine(55) synthase TruB [Desulfuribacillus stibiiarsenatis]|uniref:tRNA pseudouridine synthase B n=1 Tax=Desulfuribacillus stibiiarsenatis TaxID=1390249 RepID=A0A1E5L6R4_9FIRM|nr:tRNA pseudouridine(55) synthase TruB [Desulfuribacillus stibiiarsenatis]OEH85862.1 tRNA pseudouridine(55) synthase TruB [Desulfuribacillus stibiiarsenatis]
MLHGFINVNKPKGLTSHDVVARLRRILKTKKVGHTGTLDPDVTGVLPIAIGQATKLTEYVMEKPKTYRGTMVLGISTTTEDISGEILNRVTPKDISTQSIMDVFATLHGEIEQIPPMYSAVKVQGKKLYELARQGKEIEREPRKVQIYRFQFLDVSDVEIDNMKFPAISFEVQCSKGTYVRTLCVQVGQLLHTPACMLSLQRTESAGFLIDDSFTLEEIEKLALEDKHVQVLTPMDLPLQQMPRLDITEIEFQKMLNGMPYRNYSIHSKSIESVPLGNIFRVYNHEGIFFALYKLTYITTDYEEWKAEKVFKEVLSFES